MTLGRKIGRVLIPIPFTLKNVQAEGADNKNSCHMTCEIVVIKWIFVRPWYP